MLKREQKEQLEKDILMQIDRDRTIDALKLSEKYGITTKSIYQYVDDLIKKNQIERTSKGKYTICHKEYSFNFENKNLDEDSIWKLHIQPNLPKMTDNAQKALIHIFTEIFNNAIDHSRSKNIVVTMSVSPIRVVIAIGDDGIGIFANIKETLNLSDEKYAILELIKGKFTSDPKRHSGEGIFFSSKMADSFVISSGDLFYYFKSGNQKEIKDDLSFKNGTMVAFTVNCDSKVDLAELYQKYNSQFPEDAGFTRTAVPVKMLGYGDNETSFVSRSQAKRLLTRFDKFESVILDFDGVDSIGQGFADEVFRVFNIAHPDVVIKPINCNEQVQKMIAHVKKGN